MPRPRTHDWIDERSLALHRAVAVRLRADPEAVLGHARANLARWLNSADARSRPALLEWQEILAGSPESVAEFIASPDERARRLRQSGPFAGVLSPGERDTVFSEYESLLA